MAPEAVTATGRRQRKAGAAANALIQEHVHWATHNPYRAGGGGPEGAEGGNPDAGDPGDPGDPGEGGQGGSDGEDFDIDAEMSPRGPPPAAKPQAQTAARPSHSLSTVSAVTKKDDDDEEEGPLQDGALFLVYRDVCMPFCKRFVRVKMYVVAVWRCVMVFYNSEDTSWGLRVSELQV